MVLLRCRQRMLNVDVGRHAATRLPTKHGPTMASLACKTQTRLARRPENRSGITYQTRTNNGIVGAPDTNGIERHVVWVQPRMTLGWWEPETQSDKQTVLVFHMRHCLTSFAVKCNCGINCAHHWCAPTQALTEGVRRAHWQQPDKTQFRLTRISESSHQTLPDFIFS